MSNQRLVPLNVAALASAPAGTPKIGDLYYNTTNLKTWVYSSGGWVVAAGGGAAFQTSAPTGPQVGDIWVDSDAAINLLTPDDYALLSGPTFTGPSTVAVNSASTAFTIKQTGAGNAFVVEDSASPDSTPFVVTADGNVGIGTSTPATTLHVKTSGSQGVIRIGDQYYGNVDQNGNGLNIVSNGDQAYRLGLGTNNGSGYIAFKTAQGLTGDTERMRIDAAGNVGIGTTPTVRFDVSGGTARIRNFSGTFNAPSESVDWPVPALNIVSYGNYPLQTMLSFELPNDGNYQTGFTTWNFKLAQTASSTTSAGVAGLQLAGPGYLALGAGGAERMKIDSSGNVGIGTSTPAKLLDVNGDALISGMTVGKGAIADLTDTIVGYEALDGGAPGTQNTAIGFTALKANSANYGTALGAYALSANTSGEGNCAVGRLALSSTTTGGSNTAMGLNAMNANTTGASNTAVGASALVANTTADNNTAIGQNSLYSNTTGHSNSAHGRYSLFSNSTGIQNTAIGHLAGWGVGTNSNTTGGNNTFIGNESVGSSATASNVVTLGNGAISTLRCQVTTITALSDARDKANVETIPAGLDFVNRLSPVAFDWNTRDGAKVGIADMGFIAQDLLQVMEDTGIEVPNLVSQENPDRLEAGYGTLIPVLVQAIKELSAHVKQLQEAAHA